MKSVVAIILSVWFCVGALLPQSDMAEAGKIASLIQHFREHQREQHITFFDFLVLHYSPSSQHSQSSEHHNQHHSLPLHSCSFAAIAATMLAMPQLLSMAAVRALQAQTPKFLAHTPCYAFIFYTSIFQPPKF